MKRYPGAALPLAMLVGLGLLSGCNKMIANSTVGVMKAGTPSIQGETDIDLAEVGVAANLKMMEGLLLITPNNEDLLRMLAEGFSSYAYAFIRPKGWKLDPYSEEAEALKARVVELRVRYIGDARRRLRLMDEVLDKLVDGDVGVLSKALAKEDNKKVLDAVFWVAQTLSMRVESDLEDLEAVASVPTAKALMARVREIMPGHEYGMPNIFFGATEAMTGPGLGGSLEKSKAAFEEAFAVADGKFLLAKFMYAKTYCVAAQKRDCFERALNAVIEADPNDLPERALANQLARRWARYWLAQANELF